MTIGHHHHHHDATALAAISLAALLAFAYMALWLAAGLVRFTMKRRRTT